MIRTVLLASILLGMTGFAQAESPPEKYWVFFGTYNGPKSKGIYASQLDMATGQLSEPRLVGDATNASFLAIHPTAKYVYAIGEVGTFNGKKTGAVTAFALDAKTGTLTRLNQQSSMGSGPCHISLNPEGTMAYVANYGGGSCAALPIGEDGKLGEATGFQQHPTETVGEKKKEPRGHSINVDKSGKFAMCADLGLDKVFVYKTAKGELQPNDPPFAKLAPGAGPRHFAFHPTEPVAFVINELDSTLTAMKYDSKTGVLTPYQTLTTLPKPTKGNSTAEVVVHPNGKFVYGSNRGHNSIAIFAFDPKTGEMTAKGHQGEGINVPRNFNIDPTGKYMLVANQAGDSVVVFAIDPETGMLKPTGSKVEVGGPVCVKFLAVPR